MYGDRSRLSALRFSWPWADVAIDRTMAFRKIGNFIIFIECFTEKLRSPQ